MMRTQREVASKEQNILLAKVGPYLNSKLESEIDNQYRKTTTASFKIAPKPQPMAVLTNKEQGQLKKKYKDTYLN